MPFLKFLGATRFRGKFYENPSCQISGVEPDTKASFPADRPGAEQSVALQAQPIPKSPARGPFHSLSTEDRYQSDRLTSDRTAAGCTPISCRGGRRPWLLPWADAVEKGRFSLGRFVLSVLTPKGGPPALPERQQKFDIYGGRPPEKARDQKARRGIV
jgi:hypothetical protein